MFTYMFTCGNTLKPSTTLGAPWEDCIYDSHWEGALEVYQKIPEEARKVQWKPDFMICSCYSIVVYTMGYSWDIIGD